MDLSLSGYAPSQVAVGVERPLPEIHSEHSAAVGPVHTKQLVSQAKQTRMLIHNCLSNHYNQTLNIQNSDN